MESDLQNYLVLTPTRDGKSTFQYLSREKRWEYLAFKKVIRMRYGEPCILIGADGKSNYLQVMQAIDNEMKHLEYKNKGRMGTLLEVTKTNDIDPNEIDF